LNINKAYEDQKLLAIAISRQETQQTARSVETDTQKAVNTGQANPHLMSNETTVKKKIIYHNQNV